MVTVTKNTQENTLSFKGLKKDDKPIGSFHGLKIPNGSSFLEIDTLNMVFYDEENSRWPDPES